MPQDRVPPEFRALISEHGIQKEEAGRELEGSDEEGGVVDEWSEGRQRSRSSADVGAGGVLRVIWVKSRVGGEIKGCFENRSVE